MVGFHQYNVIFTSYCQFSCMNSRVEFNFTSLHVVEIIVILLNAIFRMKHFGMIYQKREKRKFFLIYFRLKSHHPIDQCVWDIFRINDANMNYSSWKNDQFAWNPFHHIFFGRKDYPTIVKLYILWVLVYCHNSYIQCQSEKCSVSMISSDNVFHFSIRAHQNQRHFTRTWSLMNKLYQHCTLKY